MVCLFLLFAGSLFRPRKRIELINNNFFSPFLAAQQAAEEQAAPASEADGQNRNIWKPNKEGTNIFVPTLIDSSDGQVVMNHGAIHLLLVAVYECRSRF